MYKLIYIIIYVIFVYYLIKKIGSMEPNNILEGLTKFTKQVNEFERSVSQQTQTPKQPLNPLFQQPIQQLFTQPPLMPHQFLPYQTSRIPTSGADVVNNDKSIDESITTGAHFNHLIKDLKEFFKKCKIFIFRFRFY